MNASDFAPVLFALCLIGSLILGSVVRQWFVTKFANLIEVKGQ
jgi:hypothetical protein